MANIRPDIPRSPSQFRQSVGRSIRQVLVSRGLQQRDLSARSGLRPDRLSKYMHGIQAVPLYASTKIAAALEVPLDLLVPEILFTLESDRELYRLFRAIWLSPPSVRAYYGQMLRTFSDIVHRDRPELSTAQPPGARHHASRR